MRNDSKSRPVTLSNGDGPAFTLLFETSPVPMWCYDVDTLGVFAVNSAALREYGYSLDEFVGMQVTDLAEPQGDGPPSCLFPRRGVVPLGLCLHRRRDGTIFSTDVTVERVHDRNRHVELVSARPEAGESIIWQPRDRRRAPVSEPVDDQEPAESASGPSPGLLNREAFLQRLDWHLGRRGGPRGGAENVAMLMFTVNEIAAVAADHGGVVVEQLLGMVAERLRDSLRPSDSVGRIGRTQFAVVCPALVGEIEAVGLAAGVVDDVTRPYTIDQAVIAPSVSIAVALSGDPGMTSEAIREDASRAIEQAREHGEARHHAFTQLRSGRSRQQAHLSEALQRALQRDEFVLHYQPTVDLRTDALTGVEALLRWQPPGEQILPPSQFIRTAERTGLIVALGDWVMQEAVRFAAERPNLTVSVNVSGRQVHATLIDRVLSLLDTQGVEPPRLTLEITETAVLHDADQAAHVLSSLRSAGVGLSLDDFGTGYSSLLYLRWLPVTHLKIDRFFIRDVVEDAKDRQIVAGVLRLAHAVGLAVTAEGVETLPQEQLLKAMGCDEAQGYLFAHPMPAEDFDEWRLQRGTRSRSRSPTTTSANPPTSVSATTPVRGETT